jgi:hypothetical protein
LFVPDWDDEFSAVFNRWMFGRRWHRGQGDRLNWFRRPGSKEVRTFATDEHRCTQIKNGYSAGDFSPRFVRWPDPDESLVSVCICVNLWQKFLRLAKHTQACPVRNPPSGNLTCIVKDDS